MELALILLVVLVVVAVTRSNRQEHHRDRHRHRGREFPPPLPRSASPFRERRAVNAAQLVFAAIFFPFVLLFWALASLGDALSVPVHLAVGTMASVLAMIATLVGGAPRRLWRTAGRQFTLAARALLSMLTRLLECFGLGGLVDEMKEDLKKPVPVPPAVARRPPAPRTYPFEDRYGIESHLGSGGSTARLFVVRRMSGRTPTGERLVLKYFDMGMGSHLEEVIRESRGMQVAKDMGIVLDHSLAEDHFYYVMPYYEGETLTRASARLHRQLQAAEGLPREDVRICLGWMAELLRILDGYHRHGVIHKDVKPDNVIVTESGIRLVDLGLLTPLSSALTLTTHGTEYFRDPEMVKLAVQGKRVKDVEAVRFDVYSAGAVLYLLLEGSFPACGPLSRFSRPVPMALSWITSRAMAEGRKRYPNVAAMRADLEAVTRLMDEQDPAEIPVSALPSFGGFGGAPESPPAPAFEPEPSRQAAFSPTPRVAEPRRSRSAWHMLGCISMLVLLLTAAAGIYFVAGDAGPPEPAVDLDPSHHFASALRWFCEEARALGADLDGVPVLIAYDDVRLGELMGKVRVAFDAAGFDVDDSIPSVVTVRAGLLEGVDADSLNRLLLSEMGVETLPIVLWVRETDYGRPVGIRRFELRFLYRTIDRSRVVTVQGDAR
ncbi:MAG: serine/threonine protein kinase [Planctomycetota bacterium]|jgi:hypothetical protein